jgi:hypothetical protein
MILFSFTWTINPTTTFIMEKLYRERNDYAWTQAIGKATSLTQSLASFKTALEHYVGQHEELCALDLVKDHMFFKSDNVKPLLSEWFFSSDFKAKVAYVLNLTNKTCEAAEKHQIRLIIMCHSDAVFPTLGSDIIYKADEIANDFSWDLNEWLKALQSGTFKSFHDWFEENRRQVSTHVMEFKARLRFYKESIYEFKHVFNSFETLE